MDSQLKYIALLEERQYKCHEYCRQVNVVSIPHVRATEGDPNCRCCLEPVLAVEDFYCCLGSPPFVMNKGKFVYRHAFHTKCYDKYFRYR